ncbi:hypothetical protein H6786_04315 [Candidatus Nomurabacteria bacterium]|nr:hypothetical protein [Candidatus Nomurabacteria bacterium]
MGKKCTKLGKKVYELTKGASSDSDVSQVNDILETCADDDESRVIRWALKALGPKGKKKLGPFAKRALMEFLTHHQVSLTSKQRKRFEERKFDLPKELRLQFGVKRSSK